MSDVVVISFNGFYELVGERELFNDVCAYYKLNDTDDYNSILSQHPTCKKIAVVPYFFVDENTMEPAKGHTPENLIADLSNFDLVILVCYEILMGPLEEHLSLARVRYNNTNVRVIVTDTDPNDRVHKSVFLYPVIMTDVWFTHQYQETYRLEKPKLFDALLGLNKAHRKFVFFSLHKADLLERSYVSLTALPNETKTGQRRVWYYSSDLKQLESKDVVESLDQNNNLFTGYNLIREKKPLSHQIPWNIYANSWYSIVAETHENILHTTEKIAKPLFAKRLFVLFGAPYMLQRLRDIGFKTFESIIDESYDLEVDSELRWAKAFDQVIALSKMDPVEVHKRLEAILEYNYQLCSDKEYWFNPLRTWIYKTIT
jgi:hypothetical protein